LRPEPRRVTSGALRCETAADLNEVVGHNPKTDPSLHTFEASITAAIQSVARPALASSRRRGSLEQRLLDANRTIGQPNKLTLIFGRRITRHHGGKLQTVIEDISGAFLLLAAEGTFTTRELYPQTLRALQMTPEQYKLACLRYDLWKPRVKGLVENIAHSRRNRLLAHGYQICLVFLKLYEKIYALCRGPVHPQRKDHCRRPTICRGDSGAGRPRRRCRFESSLET
jgi:hypothetical protein